MGEKTGLMTGLLIIALVVLPVLIASFVGYVKTGKLLTASTEVQQLVSAEGGVTDTVESEISRLANKGIAISIEDKNGNPVTGKVPVGEKITIHYQYGDKSTSNQVLILKR